MSLRTTLSLRSFILLPALLFLTTCNSGTQASLTGSRPNIIFILADDLGWADLPVYGNRFNEAPNLTRMAGEGIRVANAYAACPVCSPTRASIMSGQYPARVGITDFITGHWRPYEEVIVPKNRTQYLPEEIITLGEILQNGGYATGNFVKWHLGDEERHQPGNQGFDLSHVYRGGGYFDYAGRMSPPIQVDRGTVLSEALTDLSIEFIREHSSVPFFLFLAHYDVHVQLDADSLLVRKYLGKEKVDGYPCNPVYAAMVEEVDLSVGRILAELRTLGLDEKTLVVFFSDNGGLVRRFDRIPLIADSKQYLFREDTLLYVASSNAPLRGEKGTLYEGGIREPLLIRWPGSIEAGRVSDALITSVDFLPTFAELAGVDLPPAQVFDGVSMLPLMEGAAPQTDRAIFWHYPVYHHDEPASAVRKGKWKLIHNLVKDTRTLYDLEKDPGETTDLSCSEKEIADELFRLLDAWRTECHAEFPVPNPGYIPEARYEWGKHPDQY